MIPTDETITVDEVTSLLKAAGARDQRHVSEVDTVAWYQDLNLAGVSYRDASAALSHYYVNVWPRQDPRTRFRATAGVLIEIVRSARKERLDRVPAPVPNEVDGVDYRQELDALRRATAAGMFGPGDEVAYREWGGSLFLEAQKLRAVAAGVRTARGELT